MPQAFPRLRFLYALACVLGLAAPLAAQSISPAGPVNFGNVAFGSNAKATLIFSAPTATTITSITATADGVSNLDYVVAQQNCIGSVTSCTIQLTFSPTFAGPRHGALTVLGSTGNVVTRAWLTGVGIYGQLSYTPSNVGTAASADALSPASFNPTSAVPDGAGNIFYNDIANNRLLKLSNTGVYTSVAALTGSASSSLAIAGDGTIYASSPTQAVVYAVPPGGTAAAISTGAVALVTPTGLATDGLGNLYIADSGNNRIVRTALDGSGSTVVTLTGITLSSPAGLAIDAANNLYIVDSGNDRVVVLNLNTNATSVATISGLTLNNPAGIAVDPAGTLYIADTGNKRIVVVPSGGAAFALNLNGTTLGVPTGVNLFTAGNIILADSSTGLVVVVRASLTVNFPTATKVGTADTTDGFKTFTVQNTGNIALRWLPQTATANPAISNANFTDTGGTFTCPNIPAASATSPQLALGASCTYAVEFTPTNTGADNATFTMLLADAGTSGINYTPVVTLTGTGTSSLAKFAITATPTSVLIGAPVSFTVTALNSSGATATDYLGTVTFTSTDSTATFGGGTTYTFTAADAGTHTFSGASAISFHQFGSFTVSVADNAFTSASNAVQVQSPSAITLTASPNPVAVGSNVTFTATVTSASAGFTRTPTGTVTFTSTPATGATPVTLGTATLNSSGIATLTTSFSTGGTPCITAAYSGDTSFIPVNSGSYCEIVGDFSLLLDKSSSANATVVYNQSVSYTFDVAPVGSNTIVSPITISVAGLGIAAPYTVTPTTINTGAGATTVTLTITPTGHQSHQTLAMNRIAPITLALLVLPFALARRRKFSSFLAVLALMALLILPIGCSSNSGYFNPAFSLYKITVTGTSGSLTHSTVVTLTAE